MTNDAPAQALIATIAAVLQKTEFRRHMGMGKEDARTAATAIVEAIAPAQSGVEAVRAQIVALGVGCCTCGMKSAEPRLHAEYCKVLNVAQALDALDDLAASLTPSTVGAEDEAVAWAAVYDGRMKSCHESREDCVADAEHHQAIHPVYLGPAWRHQED